MDIIINKARDLENAFATGVESGKTNLENLEDIWSKTVAEIISISEKNWLKDKWLRTSFDVQVLLTKESWFSWENFQAQATRALI